MRTLPILQVQARLKSTRPRRAGRGRNGGGGYTPANRCLGAGGSFMIKQLSVVAIATVALGMAPLASAQAATHHAPKPLPNPCKTFTIKSARTLLRVGKHTTLTEKLSRTKHPATRSCTIH